MHNFKELKIWKRGILLCIDIYKLTDKFPIEERYNLISQLKRAGVSVPSNIAEGSGRNHNKEFNQFLGIAKGSLFELQTQLIISEKLEFITSEESEKQQKDIEELIRMINSFQSSLYTVGETESEYLATKTHV